MIQNINLPQRITKLVQSKFIFTLINSLLISLHSFAYSLLEIKLQCGLHFKCMTVFIPILFFINKQKFSFFFFLLFLCQLTQVMFNQNTCYTLYIIIIQINNLSIIYVQTNVVIFDIMFWLLCHPAFFRCHSIQITFKEISVFALAVSKLVDLEYCHEKQE